MMKKRKVISILILTTISSVSVRAESQIQKYNSHRRTDDECTEMKDFAEKNVPG